MTQKNVARDDTSGDEDVEATDRSDADRRDRLAQTTAEVADLLDDIDLVLRMSLDLDHDASDEVFDSRAAAMVAGYQQKGGQ